MVQNDMHNVISVGIDKLIMTNRALNITYSNTVADMSTYPYLLVGVENISGNLNGTNKTIDNAIGIMTPTNPKKIATQVFKDTCSLKNIADKATTNTGVSDAIL